MSKEIMNNFKENVKDFFLNPERNPDGSRMSGYNMQNVYAVLIGGFVGWLIITVTFGTRLKRLLKKVPVLNMVFPKAKATYRRAKARVTRYRKKK